MIYNYITLILYKIYYTILFLLVLAASSKDHNIYLYTFSAVSKPSEVEGKKNIFIFLILIFFLSIFFFLI